ncbi:MAG: hypothetical protein RL268_2409 [Pseudomonadota bacterium]
MPNTPEHDDGADGGLRDALREALASSTSIDTNDSVETEAPLDAPEPDKVVPLDQAAALADEAQRKAMEPAEKDEKPADTEKAEAKPDTPAEPEKPVEEQKAEPEKPADLAASTVDALLDGVPDDRRTEITNRLASASRVTDLFKGREAELQQHGTTPEGAVARFLQLNEFARKTPDEYVAWVVSQVAGDRGLDVLQAAAGHLGLKLVPEAETKAEEDPFEDPAIKALREENAALKAAAKTPATEFGPDTTARRVQRELDQFRTELDPASGKAKRPLFDALQARIGALAKEHHAATGQFVTTADLDRIYTQAEGEARAHLGIAATPAPPATTIAAEAKPVVAQTDKSAADIAKAKAASKSLDGTGQGAAYQPVTQETGDVRDTIRRAMAGMG